MANNRIVLKSPAPGFPGTASKEVELDTVLTSPSNRVLLLPETSPTGGSIYYTIEVPSNNWTIPSTGIRLAGTAGKQIDVEWDDGESNTYTFSGSNSFVNLIHTYSSAGYYTITINGDTDHILREWLMNVPITWEATSETSSITEILLTNITEVNTFTGLPGGATLTTLEVTSCPILANYALGTFPDLSTLTLRDSQASNTTITGSLNDLGDTYVDLDFANLDGITGTMSGLAAGAENLTHFKLTDCASSISGLIDDLPSTLMYVSIINQPNIAGSINNLPSNVFYAYFDTISSSTTGSIMGSLPSGLQYLTLIECGNNIGGTVNADIQSSLVSLTIFGTVGSPLTGFGGGDFAYFNNVRRLDLRYIAAQFTYSSRDWLTVPNGMEEFQFIPPTGYGLSQSDLDDLIIDLSLANWAGVKQLVLTGANPAPSNTTPVNDALALLASKGVNVITN